VIPTAKDLLGGGYTPIFAVASAFTPRPCCLALETAPPQHINMNTESIPFILSIHPFLMGAMSWRASPTRHMAGLPAGSTRRRSGSGEGRHVSRRHLLLFHGKRPGAVCILCLRLVVCSLWRRDRCSTDEHGGPHMTVQGSCAVATRNQVRIPLVSVISRNLAFSGPHDPVLLLEDVRYGIRAKSRSEGRVGTQHDAYRQPPRKPDHLCACACKLRDVVFSVLVHSKG
jgi:hypothetical protein